MYSLDARSSSRVVVDQLTSIASSYQQHEVRDSSGMAKARLRQSSDEVPEMKGSPLVKSSGMGMNRSKSMFSMESNLSLSGGGSSFSSIDSTASSTTQKPETGTQLPSVCVELDFVSDMRRFTGNSPHAPDFNSSVLRKVMEPHLRRARLMREESRSTSHLKVAPSIASSMGVPYTALRRECPFLFDEYTHPLHSILADTLQVKDLSQVHAEDEKHLLLPLQGKESQHAFHAAYDNFVTSMCIPLLHSMVLSKQILQYSASDRITYRYQAFPTVHISRPGGTGLSAPTCDSMLGHSLGCLTFFVPLTPCEGTNCMFIESHPGKEDWHALSAKSVGLGYLIDGARCLHFDLENTTDTSRVSLTFRVLIYRDDGGAGFCPLALLDDGFTTAGSGYYDEAVIDLRRTDAVVKKHGNRLLDPSPRVGYSV